MMMKCGFYNAKRTNILGAVCAGHLHTENACNYHFKWNVCERAEIAPAEWTRFVQTPGKWLHKYRFCVQYISSAAYVCVMCIDRLPFIITINYSSLAFLPLSLSTSCALRHFPSSLRDRLFRKNDFVSFDSLFVLFLCLVVCFCQKCFFLLSDVVASSEQQRLKTNSFCFRLLKIH